MLGEIKAIYRNDPAARGFEPILYPGLHALIAHRYIAHPLYRVKLRFIARLVSQIARFLTGIEIHPGAKLGDGGFIDHGTGIVIGETVELGDNFILYHNVTLGGTGNHIGKRHPTIGKDAIIGTGSTILWPIRIGDRVKIGANTVLIMQDIPSDSTVVGNPARIVRRNGVKVEK